MMFAKAPIAGNVKTRLGDKVGMKRAAQIYRKLLSYMLDNLDTQANIHIQLWCWPDTRHPFFLHCARRYRLSLHRQQGKDLGEKMLHATKDSCQKRGYAIIVGTDVPEIDSKLCLQSQHALQQHDVVLAPTIDGGYGLVAMNKPRPELFRNMTWSHQTVLSSTLKRAQRRKLSVHCFKPIRDVDTYNDYKELLHSNRLPGYK